MYNNSFMGNSYSSPMYNPYAQNYTGYQPVQPTQRPTQSDVPFSEVRFGTLDEAKAYIVPPLKAVMFINKDFSECYVKSADNMGKPSLETFKMSKTEDYSQTGVSTVLDPKEFVKMQDLEGLATKDDLKAFLTADNTQNFVTKDDIKVLTDKIEQLQKQVKINAILKGDEVNGK